MRQFGEWVHSEVDETREVFATHRAYLGVHASLGVASLAAMPFVWLLSDGAPAVSVMIAAIACTLLGVALFVSRTGQLRSGQCISLGLIHLSLGALIYLTGGLSSPIALIAALTPLIWSLMESRKLLLAGFAAALASTFMPGVVSAEPVSNLQILALSGAFLGAAVVSFLTLRKGERLQRQLASARQRATLAVEQTRELVTRHDAQGSTLFASEQAKNIFGTAASELLRGGFCEKIHLQDRVSFLKMISDVIESRRPQECEVRVRSKGTTQVWRWLHVNCSPSPTGDDRAAICVSRDISDLKSAEAERVQALASVEEMAKGRRQFLATVSHELRTPLNAIVGFSDILDQELFGSLEQKRHRDYVTHIRDAGQHLLRVVNDMLDMSQLDAGRLELALEPVRLCDLANTTAMMLEPQRIEANLRVLIQVDPSLPELMADKRACRQIMINLLSNAIKFTPKGGEVLMRARRFGPYVKLEIIDNGIGIPADFLHRVGKPFQQADPGRDRKFEGAGLGLSVVRGLVELHGGAFEIESNVGRGTRVSVTLPIKAKKPAAVPAKGSETLVQLEPSKAEETASKSQYDERQYKGEKHARISA